MVVWNTVTFVEYAHLWNLLQLQVPQDCLDGRNLDLQVCGARIHHVEEYIGLTQLFQGRAKRTQ